MKIWKTNNTMNQIKFIKKDRTLGNIYRKGEVFFRVDQLSKTWLAIVLKDDLSGDLFVDRQTFIDKCIPTIQQTFPSLDDVDWSWIKSTDPDNPMGQVYLCTDDFSTSRNKFLRTLSDNPNEEFPLTFMDMDRYELINTLKLFREELDRGSYILERFDYLFPQPR